MIENIKVTVNVKGRLTVFTFANFVVNNAILKHSHHIF